MSDFPTTLKRIRLSKGMTLEEFAALLGTSKQNISRYENGEVSPKISTAAAMADKLGISLAELNGGEKVTQLPRGLTDSERQLLAAFRALNADGQQYVLSTVQMCSNNPSMKKDSENKVG